VDSVASVPVQRFLEKPEAFPLPVVVTGRFGVRALCRWKDEYHDPPMPGSCGPFCEAVMALVPAIDERDPARRRTRIEMIRHPVGFEFRDQTADERTKGVALILPPGIAGGRVECSGDDTGICCPYPVDGRDIRVTFTRRLDPPPRQPAGEGFYFVDYDGLMLENICSDDRSAGLGELLGEPHAVEPRVAADRAGPAAARDNVRRTP
jgi:hypothetical protein